MFPKNNSVSLSFNEAKLAAIKTKEKLLGFKGLDYGWDLGRSGKPVTDGFIQKGLHLLDEIANQGITRTNAFPGPEGEVRVTAYKSIFYLEFTIEIDGTISCVIERGEHEIVDKESLSLEEAECEISTFKELTQCSSLGYSTQQNIMTKESIVFRVGQFLTQVIAVESQSSIWSVSSGKEVRFVNT